MFDPLQPTLRQRFDKGEAVGVIWLVLGSPAMVEIAGRSRPDAIVLDFQHGLWDRLSLESAIGVVPSRIPVLVRVAENTPQAIGHALDAGAEGVIVPLVESAQQARNAVKAARYPPIGMRSSGGVRPMADFPAYVDGARRGIVVCVMIETARGVRNAREIAAVAGVDLVFIGPGDLSLSLGAFPRPDRRLEDAYAAVRKACKRERVPCGIFTTSLDAARARCAQGFRMIVTANDIQVAASGFAAASSGFASAMTGSNASAVSHKPAETADRTRNRKSA